ncbi:MAG: peptidylprolyl isomerase [Pyrinomonadaceae bacterium]|nr:peptidylprolyl isomerase [Sphingobacteriaceae bacterium]
MKRLVLPLLLLSISFAFAAKPKTYYVRIKTAQGESIVRLYNKTPLHRDNFVKLAKSGFFNGTLFHRVMNTFMIQGGDPDSKTAKPGQALGNGGLNYTIPAEFDTTLFHKKGVIAAARDGNPAKASSSTQFYLVQGKRLSNEELNMVERSAQGRKIAPHIRKIYQTVGGTPFLDQNYTVFGEIVRGLEQVDSIASVKTDGNNRPLTDIAMQVSLLKKKEIKKLEKELIKETVRNNMIMR